MTREVVTTPGDNTRLQGAAFNADIAAYVDAKKIVFPDPPEQDVAMHQTLAMVGENLGRGGAEANEGSQVQPKAPNAKYTSRGDGIDV